MDKHSRLLRAFVNYNRKKFYNVGPSCRNDTTLKVYYVINFSPFLIKINKYVNSIPSHKQ
jgi:hypothetical protein